MQYVHFCPQFFQGITIVTNIINFEGGGVQLNPLNPPPWLRPCIPNCVESYSDLTTLQFNEKCDLLHSYLNPFNSNLTLMVILGCPQLYRSCSASEALKLGLTELVGGGGEKAEELVFECIREGLLFECVRRVVWVCKRWVVV